MQLLESTIFGLRSARITLKSPISPVEVTLFPMVHVGEPDFYRAVYEDAFSHDVVLVEGVRSPIVRRITMVYRWVANSKRIGLALQSAEPPPPAGRATIVHADLTGAEFKAAWRKITEWVRVTVYFYAAIVGLRYRWFGSRKSLAKGMSLDDLPSREETMSWDWDWDPDPEFAALHYAIIGARDARLLERLCDQLDNNDPNVRRIAVVYGAGHMPAVLRDLTGNRQYYAADARWLTIFPLEIPSKMIG